MSREDRIWAILEEGARFPRLRGSAKDALVSDPQQTSIDAILDLVESGACIAVVGISDNPARPSNEVAGYLLAQRFRILPVTPVIPKVFELSSSPALSDCPETPDVVNVFRRSSEAGAIVDEAVAVGARAVWLQEGVIDDAAAARAADAGLLVVMDRCILKEHARRTAARAE